MTGIRFNYYLHKKSEIEEEFDYCNYKFLKYNKQQIKQQKTPMSYKRVGPNCVTNLF